MWPINCISDGHFYSSAKEQTANQVNCPFRKLSDYVVSSGLTPGHVLCTVWLYRRAPRDCLLYIEKDFLWGLVIMCF